MSETHVSPEIPDSDLSLDGYQLFRKDRNRQGGGVCIYVNNSIPTNRLNNIENANTEIIWLKMHVDNNTKTIYFGVCYRPPGQSNI